MEFWLSACPSLLDLLGVLLLELCLIVCALFVLYHQTDTTAHSTPI